MTCHREKCRRRGLPPADLYPSGDAAAVHSAGHVHRVAPDVILRLSGAHHAGNHGALVYT